MVRRPPRSTRPCTRVPYTRLCRPARCAGPAGVASPDPCIAGTSTAGGRLEVTALSAHASRWDLVRPTSGSTAAACRPHATLPFGDVTAGNPHRMAVGCLVEHGITTGIDADTYGPASPVTRGQMATFLLRLLEASGVEVPEASAGRPFLDVRAADVHAGSIASLADLGIVRGTGGGLSRPKARSTGPKR